MTNVSMNIYKAHFNNDNYIEEKCYFNDFYMKVCLTTIEIIFIWPCFYTLHVTSTSTSKTLSKEIRKLCCYFEMILVFQRKYVFLVDFGVHLFKIAMPLRADIIVINQCNSYIIWLPPLSNYM